MRAFHLAGLGLMLVALAACGTPPEADITTNGGTPVIVEQPTTDPFVIVTLSSQDATEDMMAGIPGFGTLEASSTEDPNIDMIFSEINLYVYGGEEGTQPLSLTLLENGTYTRNEFSGTVSPQRVTEIDTLLDELNFFGLQANFIGFGASNVTKYRLRVVRGTQERMIDSEEGYMPTQYNILLGELLKVGIVP